MPKPRRPNATGRGGGERHIRLPHYMLRSAAWLSLTPNAKALFLAVWERHNGVNNGEISYGVREAAQIGLSKDQAARAFLELADRMFLKVQTNSSFTMKTKLARTWEITAEACDGKPAKKDFMRWQRSPKVAAE